MTIIGSTISGNTASSGGGIFNSGALTVARTAISGNTATLGAGIFNNNDGALTVTDSVISGNTALPTGYLGDFYGGCGGGICHSGSALTITGTTISGNVASGEGRGFDGRAGSAGGGVYLYGSSSYSSNAGVSITNSIITFNSAENGSDFYDSNGARIHGTNNIIGFDPGFVVAPVFEDGILINADELDLSLTAQSIAIDRGTNSVVETETDFAGEPRIFASWRDIPTVDIGAYEYQGHTELSSIVVTTLEDVVDDTDGLISLREAVSMANTGENITFASDLAGGTIILNGSQIEVTKGIIIDATSIGGMTINADGKSRVFYVHNASEDDVLNNIRIPTELVGLTITGGNADDNGHNGGGILNEGLLTVTNSTVAGNTAQSGGGIYNGNSYVHTELTVINSLISGNADTGLDYNCGGGIFNDGVLTIVGSTISGNTSENGCGGIFNDSWLTITGSTISGNIGRDGGGIYTGYSSSLSVVNSVIFGNAAEWVAGIYNGGMSTVINSTISGNTAEEYCSGIYSEGTLTLTNSIVALNYDYCSEGDISSDPDSGTNNIIGFDPGFVVAPVFDEDGLLINADEIDLSLTEGSVAIDAGMNDAVTAEFDIARNPRIVNGIVDIGAYEYHETPSTVVTILLDIVDEVDGLISLREAITYAAEGEVVTFDASLSGQTIVLSGEVLTVDKGISIDATDIGGITIDADGQSGVFYVSGGDEANPVELIGLTITGGNSGGGGGIFNDSGTLTITNSTISGNTASDGSGGGIGNDDYGTLTLTNTIISLNYAGYNGND
ncbi:MAG: hypothetical protein J6S40_03310, partial [Thermoguttaceae bacterium]|nr:hypothetical protein [Thermoguttaceae bacterium]